MVYERDDVEGLDSSILTNPKVLQYSGHEDTFADPLVDCRSCKSRCRADELKEIKCPSFNSEDLTEPRPFNLMLKTNIGLWMMTSLSRIYDQKLRSKFLLILRMFLTLPQEAYLLV